MPEKKVKTDNIIIQVDRDSVCMGDDCLSHEENMFIPEDMRLSELMRRLVKYIPATTNRMWVIWSDVDICGYIITDSDANASFAVCGMDLFVGNMKIHKIMCKYYDPSLFSWTDAETRNRVEKYSECGTFLEKVKKDSE
ncbi:MAG: hypothetical protein NC420_00205 [Eubacterium sp.]|nr:hypothetical protein [Eubacterium sp.]MCM1302790.1 hypothetical protein [Butyrivibrio sp.]